MNIKKILVFGILGLMLAGGAGLGCKLFSKKDEGDAATAEGADAQGGAQADAAKAPAPSQPPPPAIPPDDDDDGSDKVAANFTKVINLPPQPGAKSAFLKATISVIAIDEELGKALASPTPTYERSKTESIFLEALNKMTPEELDDSEAQLTFAQDIKDQLNELFRPKPSTGGDKKKEKEKKEEKEKDAKPRPLRPIKEVLILEWAFQR